MNAVGQTVDSILDFQHIRMQAIYRKYKIIPYHWMRIIHKIVNLTVWIVAMAKLIRNDLCRHILQFVNKNAPLGAFLFLVIIYQIAFYIFNII